MTEFKELKDFCYGNRSYVKAAGHWYRMTSLDEQCVSQRESRKWNNAFTSQVWV